MKANNNNSYRKLDLEAIRPGLIIEQQGKGLSTFNYYLLTGVGNDEVALLQLYQEAEITPFIRDKCYAIPESLWAALPGKTLPEILFADLTNLIIISEVRTATARQAIVQQKAGRIHVDTLRKICRCLELQETISEENKNKFLR